MRAFSDFLLRFGAAAREIERAPSRTSHPAQTIQRADGRFTLRLTPSLAGELLTEREGKRIHLWVLGELFRYRDRKGSTRECAQWFLEDLEAGKEDASALDGQFALATWQESEDCWSFWTDRCGTVHLYYADNPEGITIGTYSPAVYASSRRSLDWEAMSGFFQNGFFSTDRTFYRDVKILQGARRYQFDGNGRFQGSREYWRWEHNPSAERSENATIEEFGATLNEIVKDHCSRGRVVLPLSGGLDSRTLAASVPSGGEVSAYSYGYEAASRETAISRQIAAARSLPFTEHVIQPYLFDRLDSVVRAVEGFQDVTQSRQASVSSWLGETGDAVLAGHLGDVWCDDMEVRPGMAGEALLDHTLSKLAKPGHEWLLKNVSQANHPDAGPAFVRETMREELEKHRGIADPDFRVKVVKITQWTFRWTLASVRMYQAGAYPRMPFYDPRMIDFFCTVPTAMVSRRRIQTEYLKRYAPDLARITWQAYDANLYWAPYFNSLLLPKRAVRWAQRKVAPSRNKLRNWEVQFCQGDSWRRLEEHLLDPGLSIHGFVDRAQINALLHRLKTTPNRGDGYAVSMLLTFSTWLESFHHSRIPTCAS